ncbi:MAG: iron-containing alcohol dehydrogenase, partial [Prevotella sp.]|nr:iron-containing alcohol dehydrogenase [Prevotella sp.]
MKDFSFYSPTKVVFGRSSEEQLPALVSRYGGTKVLVHYGGGSARRSGLLDKVFQMLASAGIEYAELGGVVPNPLLSKVEEGIALCRREPVDFI